MKVPRDVNADVLIAFLQRHGYTVVRQTGSHIRMEATRNENVHGITVPNHKPIKIGTLSQIMKDVSSFIKIHITELYRQL